MRLYPYILVMFLGLTVELQAQIQVIPRSQLESVANPALSDDARGLRFETESIVAEDMTEDDGIRSFSYTFRNIGADTITIDRVVTSCSCAVATYRERHIAPGSQGEIVVKYNPKGHPGRFVRKIFIYTGGYDAPAAVLRLQVNVECGKDVSGLFPVSVGKLRLRRNEVSFSKGTRTIEKCVCINVSDVPVKLACEQFLLPPFLKFIAQPEVLQPGEEGSIMIEYVPSGRELQTEVLIMLKGLGAPPSQSAIKVKLK